MTALALRTVTRRFGQTRAVDGVSLEVDPGEFICLLGPSGCGKSTALRMIAGFETPDDGDILIDGASMLGVPPNRRPTSMVFQSHALWSHMTVAGNIGFGLKLRRLPAREVTDKVAAALELVGLAGFEKRYPAQLSGGQQQRVALARSLVLQPKILLLDEPFSSLDAHLRLRLRDELKAIQRRLGLTTIFVTHDQEEAMALANRIVVMNRGAVEQIAAPGTLYDRPATLFTAGFIGTMTMHPARREGGWLVAGPIRLRFSPEAEAREWTLALRPEDCELAAPGAPDGVPGTIEHVADLGPIRIATIVLADGTLAKAQVGRRRAAAKGDAVTLTLSRALLYGDDRAPIELVSPRLEAAAARPAPVAA
ncbi:ABC transporter ATP-binding protein [Labrys wisconsinensis]|uniref:Spermidine/putrescine transport system ATP-binding protein n=1 Tax=Labrys wisconsinensis TaxID=425677 RepID=A0ABU0JCW8_9HYPH|nr:ABC transporter ATP-binding protein [Labrys wisconsinensis]MDQ0472136.1 putative spermidine/putrescine transport system ATP-binding protein [Labrys wisconsinensis]